jgi:hypothetical protein
MTPSPPSSRRSNLNANPNLLARMHPSDAILAADLRGSAYKAWAAQARNSGRLAIHPTRPLPSPPARSLKGRVRTVTSAENSHFNLICVAVLNASGEDGRQEMFNPVVEHCRSLAISRSPLENPVVQTRRLLPDRPASRLLRFARNDSVSACHWEEHSDEAISVKVRTGGNHLSGFHHSHVRLSK